MQVCCSHDSSLGLKTLLSQYQSPSSLSVVSRGLYLRNLPYHYWFVRLEKNFLFATSCIMCANFQQQLMVVIEPHCGITCLLL